MKNIVLLLTSLNDLNNPYVDSVLIPIKGLSSRSQYELDIDKVLNIKKNTNKNIYLLCDKLISEEELNSLKPKIKELFSICDLIFFQDLSIFMIGKSLNQLDKLCYYSPTLIVSYQDLFAYSKLGLTHFVLSKEDTYDDYNKILKNKNNLHLGMLCFGYPQIYYSKRKMVSSFKKQYNLEFSNDNLTIKEKTRPMYQPIVEDNNGTYIFAGEIFFPFKVLNDFLNKGMEYFIIDKSFVNLNNVEEMVYNSINGKDIEDNNFSTYLMYKEMVNDYGK